MLEHLQHALLRLQYTRDVVRLQVAYTEPAVYAFQVDAPEAFVQEAERVVGHRCATRVVQERIDEVVACLDDVVVGGNVGKPVAQEPFAHLGARFVEQGEERASVFGHRGRLLLVVKDVEFRVELIEASHSGVGELRGGVVTVYHAGLVALWDLQAGDKALVVQLYPVQEHHQHGHTRGLGELQVEGFPDGAEPALVGGEGTLQELLLEATLKHVVQLAYTDIELVNLFAIVFPKLREGAQLVPERFARAPVVHTQLVEDARVEEVLEGGEHDAGGGDVGVAVDGLQLGLATVRIKGSQVGVAFAVSVLFDEQCQQHALANVRVLVYLFTQVTTR